MQALSRFLPASASQTLSRDLPASVVVFLVALPLCMGIAIASGVPPERGLITGIVGGIVMRDGFRCDVEIGRQRVGLRTVVLLRLRARGREIRQRMAGQQTGRAGLHGRGHDRHQLRGKRAAHGRQHPEGKRDRNSETTYDAE